MKKTLHLYRILFKRRRWLLTIAIGFGLASLLYAHTGDVGHVLAEVTGNNPGGGVGGGGGGSGDSGGLGIGAGLGTIVSGLATLFLKLLSGILWAVLYWMGDLMDNTFILEGQIGEKLRSVWVIVRNFVNIFFALMLVIAALMSVVGYGDEGGNYAMKKFIPKMALALIAVNFTFFACRIVLDLNNVLTTAIFSIPQSVTNLTDIGPTGTAGVKIFNKFNCLSGTETVDTEVARVAKIAAVEKYKNVINSLGGVCFAANPAGVPGLTPDPEQGEPVDLNSSKFTKKDFVWAMATQFQGLHNLNKVAQLTDRSFTNLTVNALFSMVFAVVYATAYVSMFIILLGRMIMIWIFVMLSPLAAVAIVIPDILPEQISVSKFINQAFVPAKMAIPLSFGYILLSQMAISIDTSSNIATDRVINLNSGEFARDISITSIMYGAASIGIIWTGVFTASKDVLGSGLVEKVEGFVKGAGQTVAKWPTYLPVIPVIGGGLASPQTILSGVSELRNVMAEQQRSRDQAIVDRQLEALGIVKSEAQRVINDIERRIENKSMDGSTANRVRELAAGPNANIREFDRVSRSLANTTWGDAQSRINIAQSMGFAASEAGFEEFRTMVNNRQFEQLRTKVQSTQTQQTPPRADYGSIVTSLSGVSGVSEVNAGVTDDANKIDIGRLHEDVRRGLGDVTAERPALNFNNMTPQGLVNALKHQSLGSGQIRTLMRTGMLKQIAASNQEMKAAMAGDPELLRILARSTVQDPRSEDDKQGNIAIRQAFEAITGKTADADLTALGNYGDVIARINGSSGEYRRS